MQKVVSCDDSQSSAGKRKKTNHEYYARNKDKRLEKVSLQNLENSCNDGMMQSANDPSTSHGTRATGKENIMPRSKEEVAQSRKDTNKSYYERMKEKKRKLARDLQQGNNEALSTIGETIQAHHATCDEENSQIYSVLTHETSNG